MSSAEAGKSSTFSVRIPKVKKSKISIFRFSTGMSADFSQDVQISRENNLKTFRLANDVGVGPQTGAGSVYGQQAKEEARKKKLGMILKNYKAEEQPWLLEVGKGNKKKRYKGTKEGGISENANYYIFTKGRDGTFDATLVDEWYSFAPEIKYRYLNSEEAEEEFEKRDKTLDKFSIMFRRKIRSEGEDSSSSPGSPVGGQSKKRKKLALTEADDDDEDRDDEEEYDEDGGSRGLVDDDGDDDDESHSKNKKKSKSGGANKDKTDPDEDDNSDDEGQDEELVDVEEQEIDYMSSSGEENEADDETMRLTTTVEARGIEDEEEMSEFLGRSIGQEEEEEDRDKEEKDDDGSSSESGLDELEKGSESNPIFLQTIKRNSPNTSRSNTPTSSATTDITSEGGGGERGNHRKQQQRKRPASPAIPGSSTASTAAAAPTGGAVSLTSSQASRPSSSSQHLAEEEPSSSKKIKTDTAPPNRITEDAIKRYLSRKPMSIKELFLKLRDKKITMSSDEVAQISDIINKLKPQKQKINGVLQLYLPPSPPTTKP